MVPGFSRNGRCLAAEICSLRSETHAPTALERFVSAMTAVHVESISCLKLGVGMKDEY